MDKIQNIEKITSGKENVCRKNGERAAGTGFSHDKDKKQMEEKVLRHGESKEKSIRQGDLSLFYKIHPSSSGDESLANSKMRGEKQCKLEKLEGSLKIKSYISCTYISLGNRKTRQNVYS